MRTNRWARRLRLCVGDRPVRRAAAVAVSSTLCRPSATSCGAWRTPSRSSSPVRSTTRSRSPTLAGTARSTWRCTTPTARRWAAVRRPAGAEIVQASSAGGERTADGNMVGAVPVAHDGDVRPAPRSAVGGRWPRMAAMVASRDCRDRDLARRASQAAGAPAGGPGHRARRLGEGDFSVRVGGAGYRRSMRSLRPRWHGRPPRGSAGAGARLLRGRFVRAVHARGRTAPWKRCSSSRTGISLRDRREPVDVDCWRRPTRTSPSPAVSGRRGEKRSTSWRCSTKFGGGGGRRPSRPRPRPDDRPGGAHGTRLGRRCAPGVAAWSTTPRGTAAAGGRTGTRPRVDAVAIDVPTKDVRARYQSASCSPDAPRQRTRTASAWHLRGASPRPRTVG